jgi:hypothetical protein
MSIMMLTNTVEVYRNLALALYTKRLVFKAVVAVSVMSTTISKWLKALLASSILVEVALLSVRSLNVVK